MAKSANGAGNIRKRSDGRWECRFTYTDSMTGKAVRKSIYGQTQREVRQKLTAAIAEIDKTQTFFEPTKMTVSQWLDVWLKEHCGDKKVLTIKQYRGSIENHIKPALGQLKLAELKPVQIQHFYNALTETEANGKQNKPEKNQKTLSAKSIRNIHGTLSKALNDAVKMELIESNPCERATLPKVTKKEISPLTDENVKDFIKACKGDNEYGRLLRVILFTGLREAEAIGLTWDSIDFTNGTLTIEKQLQRRTEAEGGYQFAPLKNSKTRTITASKYVMQLLKEERLHQMECRMAAGENWKSWRELADMGNHLCFVKADGEHLNVTVVYNRFKKIAESIGVPAARVHDLRHTFAVLSLQNGDDIKTVQTNLGHATAAFTLDVYGHASEKMKQDAANRMQSYIDAALKEA